MTHVLHPPLIQLPNLAAHHSRRAVYAAFVLVACGTAIGIIAAVAYGSGYPLVVPSLGPTAFLVFNRSQSSAARPRNIVIGHLIGAVSGYVALAIFGLLHTPSVLEGGLTAPRIGAAALSIALTAATMILLRAEHGPAGATTLIVSLGFMTTPRSLSILMAGVVGLAILGVAIDRLVGLQLPYWSGHPHLPGSQPARQKVPSPHASVRLPVVDALPTIGNGTIAPVEASQRASRSRAGTRALRRWSLGSTVAPDWLTASGEGRNVLVGSEQCTVKVQDAHAAGSYSMLEVVLDPALPATLLHVHYDFTESYFILEGDVIAEVGTERHRASPGTTICVPAGVPHLLSATGNRPARCLCITDRAQHSDHEFLP